MTTFENFLSKTIKIEREMQSNGCQTDQRTVQENSI